MAGYLPERFRPAPPLIPEPLRTQLKKAIHGKGRVPWRVRLALCYALKATVEAESGRPTGYIEGYKFGVPFRFNQGIADLGVRPPAPGGIGFAEPQPYLLGRERGGIDAYSFDVAGGRGEEVDVTLVDLGFLQHVDLPEIEQCLVPLDRPEARELPANLGAHGTAMLGVMVAVRDACDSYGPGAFIDGIVDQARTRRLASYSSRQLEGGSSSSSNMSLGMYGIWASDIFPAIVNAMVTSEAPGVLVIPVDAVKVRRRCGNVENSPRLGLEAWPIARALFILADFLGFITVVAAGNGYGARIEDFRGRRFYPSPAIVVGGGEPKDCRRCPDSNRGSRVDLHAWGKHVTTLQGTDQITHRFGGTSSATAIVAGAVAAVYSAILKNSPNPRRPSSRLVRNLLVCTGYSRGSYIGARPDLRAAKRVLEGAGYDPRRLPWRIRRGCY